MAAFITAIPVPLRHATHLATQPCRPYHSKLFSHSSPQRMASRATITTTTESEANEQPPLPEPNNPSEQSTRMFSNIAPDKEGTLQRVRASEAGCAALVAGTMIGAGVLALPSVAAPAGFVPSSLALVAVWAYMAATGLLISEVSINTACTLGRPGGVSLLSLGQLTLGNTGAVVTAFSYTLLHYAILTAYTSQGGAMLSELESLAERAAHITSPSVALPQVAAAALFASAIGGGMYALSAGTVERINNALVTGVMAAFTAVVLAAGTHVDAARLFSDIHWVPLMHGQIISVLFVSCVYHNVVSTITMRLEGDRRKIRRVILGGSALPLGMFLIYNAVILGSGGLGEQSGAAVAGFSLLAVATSFVGFVEGLTELWEDVRLSGLRESEGRVSETRYRNFLATLVPPVMFTAVSPDMFLQALDAAGTYGIAVLFGGLPAAMAWRNRRRDVTKGFSRLVGGGDFMLAAVAVIPVLLIGNKIWDGLQHSLM